MARSHMNMPIICVRSFCGVNEVPDFTNCKRVPGRAYNGANGKKIAIEHQGEQYMLKFPPSGQGKRTELSYTNSCISEHIASTIFNMVGIPAQETILGTYDVGGKTLGKKIQVHSLEVPANTSKCVYRAKLDGWLTPEDCRRSFLKLILKDKSGHQVAESVHFFRKTKDLQLPPISVSYQMKQTDGKCELTLFSSMLAKDIFIETPLQGARYSDNFFDLLPGERKKVIITSPRIKKGEELPVNIKHIRETYK